MPRGKAEHPTHTLGIQFVKHFLKQEFDFRFHGRFLRDAKRLVNPDKEGEKALDPVAIWGCLLALEKGMFGFEGQINSMWVCTYGNADGNYLDQYIKWSSVPPNYYETDLVKEWQEMTGKVAFSGPVCDTINTQILQLPTL